MVCAHFRKLSARVRGSFRQRRAIQSSSICFLGHIITKDVGNGHMRQQTGKERACQNRDLECMGCHYEGQVQCVSVLVVVATAVALKNRALVVVSLVVEPLLS